MSRSDYSKSWLRRKAIWLLPALLVLVILTALLVLSDGGVLSALRYKAF